MALSPTEESLVRQLIAQNPALLNLASSESTIISKLGATKVSLSDLSAATNLSDADLALVRQGLNDKSFVMSVLSDYVNSKLPAASEAVAGIIEIATAGEAQAFTANKAIDGAKLAAAFGGANQGLTANGYQKLPGGLIVQWGVVSTAATSGTVTFPTAFPNACFSAVSHDYATVASDISNVRFNLPTKTGVSWLGQTFSGSSVSPTGWTWIVIGY